jgi:pathogenesis-related protein 1
MKIGSRALSSLLCSLLRQVGTVLLIASAAEAQSQYMSNRPGGLATGSMAQEMLISHNAIRSDLKLPPLRWSNELAAFAQKWANTLLREKRLRHNPESPYGENIFASGAGSTASMAVMEWAAESRDYEYRANACKGDCGHYTQIVWRETSRVGCGVARDSQREVWVCSYDPPGNYRGEWPY